MSNYYAPNHQNMPDNGLINMLFSDRYQVESKLGDGAFAQVYKVLNREDGKRYAAKFEEISSPHQELYVEYKILLRLGKEMNVVGVPKVYFYGVSHDKNMLVTDLLGDNIKTKLEECGGVFTLKTTLMLAEQMIKRVELIHSKRIIHRDLKPSNFIVGTGIHTQTIYLIDFGKAKKYMDSEGRHIQMKTKKLPVGNIRYSSVSADQGNETSRRDDLETLVYLLIYFLRGTLPWKGMQGKTIHDKFKAVRTAKAKCSMAQLCEGIPAEFGEMIKYTRDLDFDQEPNYQTFKGHLKRILQGQNIQMDFIYDWKVSKSVPTNNQGPPQKGKDGKPVAMKPGNQSPSPGKTTGAKPARK